MPKTRRAICLPGHCKISQFRYELRLIWQIRKNWNTFGSGTRKIERVRAYREETKEKRNARRRELYAAEEERRIKARADVKKWWMENPDKRKRQRLRKHGITLEQYQAMLSQQNGKCAICGYDDTSDPNFFPLVDHCHTVNKVRGLLCMNCNQALGKMKDSIERLTNAIQYLQSFQDSVEQGIEL